MIKITYRPDKITAFCTIFVGCFSAIYSFLSPPVYKATFQLSIETGNVASTMTKDLDSMQTYIEAERKGIKDRDLVESVVDKLHLRLSKRFASGDAVSIIQKALRVDHTRGTNLVNISVYMDSPELASKIAQALAESYLAKKEEKKFAFTKEAIAWFKEANEASKRVAQSEEALNKFVKENKLESFGEDLEKIKELLKACAAEKEQKEDSAKELEKRVEVIVEVLKHGDREKAYILLKDNANLYGLKSAKEEAEQKIAKLKTIYEESHPDIVKLRREIENINKDTKGIINNTLKSDKMELEILKERIEHLSKEISNAKENLSRMKETEVKLNDLTRKVEIGQRFYNEVLNRLKEGSFSLIEVTNLGLAGQQEALTTPVGPKKMRNILIGVVAGFILGNALSFIIRKRLKTAALLAILFLTSGVGHSTVELEKAGTAKKNIQKGYDFFDASGKKTGCSMPNRRGGYDFYDGRGNRVGRLQQESGAKNSYTFHDAYGIKKGSLKKAPSGEYSYRDIQSGRVVSSLPQLQGDLGSLSPDTFQGKRR